MNIPEKVMNLLGDEASIKILSSVSADGKVHSITAGSIMPMDNDKLIAMEIFMNVTSENLQATKSAAILAVNGKESYLLNVTSIDRQYEGVFYETMTKNLRDKGMPIRAIWTFQVDEVYDQSAAASAGTKLA